MSRFVTGLASVVLVLAAVPVAAQATKACPAVIASLLPRIGVNPTGSFNKVGEMGMGSGVAEIPFNHPCITSTKTPARLTLAVTYYGGEMAAILQTQGDAADQQTIENARAELTRAYTSVARAGVGEDPVRTESVSGATVVYFGFKSECPAQGAAGSGTTNRPPVPSVRLKGVARTANARMEISLEGQITIELAMSIVNEVVENLKRATFTARAPGGK